MITFKEELFKNTQRSIAALVREHWEEVTYFPHIEVDVNWERFAQLDKEGVIKVLTARDNGKLVGYMIFLIAYGLHYKKTLMAHDDAFFLQKQFRKGRNGIKFFEAAEEMARHHGIQIISFHEKIKVPCGKILKRLGYEAHEVKWFKELK